MFEMKVSGAVLKKTCLATLERANRRIEEEQKLAVGDSVVMIVDKAVGESGAGIGESVRSTIDGAVSNDHDARRENHRTLQFIVDNIVDSEMYSMAFDDVLRMTSMGPEVPTASYLGSLLPLFAQLAPGLFGGRPGGSDWSAKPTREELRIRDTGEGFVIEQCSANGQAWRALGNVLPDEETAQTILDKIAPPLDA